MQGDAHCQKCPSGKDIMLKTTHAFNCEAIEIGSDTHCQYCLSGKDIMLKTTQPFFKSSYELHLIERLSGF